MLVPKQTFTELGIRILVLSCAAWVTILVVDLTNTSGLPKEFRRHYIINVVLDQIAIIAYLISGIVILLEGEKGLYYIVSAIVFSFIKAVIDAWVLLVEINR